MDSMNKAKATFKGKITRIENYVQNIASDVELKVKRKNVEILQKKADVLRSEYYTISEMKDVDLANIDDELNQCEDRLKKIGGKN